MSLEAQRIAIAEACGWTQLRSDYSFACGITHSPGDGLVGISPINSSQGLTNPETCSWIVPDYLNSLDAMHEAEKVLTNKQWSAYSARLWLITNRPPSCYECHATAAQRAEAFLRTLNLWTE